MVFPKGSRNVIVYCCYLLFVLLLLLFQTWNGMEWKYSSS